MEMNNFCYPPVLQTAVYNVPIKTGCDDKNSKKFNRKNPWGSRSYADLITQAIESSTEKRLTLSQIYDWLIRNVPYFSDKGENNSSAGWKNSIRHNLSLHKKFHRIKNDGIGKSSWWTVNAAAGSGRVPRRKVPYRRRRGKALAAHRQLGNLPSLLRSNRCGFQSHSLPQRNIWPGRSSWNALQSIREPAQLAFQSTPSMSTGISSTYDSKLFNPNRSLVNALRENSSKADLHLPLPNQNSESIYATQTLSLRQTNSENERSYLHEHYVFQQMSSVQQTSVISSRSLSTEYFSIPHHLSGSYITEVGIEKISELNETIATTLENSMHCNTEQEPTLNASKINDLDNKDIDLLLSSNYLLDVANLQEVLKDLCDEADKCGSFHNSDSVINQLPNNKNSNLSSEENTTDFQREVGDIETSSKDNLFVDSMPAKVFSKNEITISDLQNQDSNYINMSPNGSEPFSFNSELKNEERNDFAFDSSSNPGITEDRSDAECIEKIIERLNSPKSEYICSDSEKNGEVSNFIENQLGLVKSPKVFNCKNLTFCLSPGKQIEIYDSNLEIPSSLPEYMKYSNVSPNCNLYDDYSYSPVNEEENLSSDEFMPFVSDESNQWNLESSFSSYLNVPNIDEISRGEKVNISKKRKDVTNLLLSKSNTLTKSDLGNAGSENYFDRREMSEARLNICVTPSLKDDITCNNELQNSVQNNNVLTYNYDSCDSLPSMHKNKNIYPQSQYEFYNNDLEFSSDLKIPTFGAHNNQPVIEDISSEISVQNFNEKARVLMVSGMENSQLMDNGETNSDILVKQLSEISNISNIFEDAINSFVDVDTESDAKVFEDYFLHCLKDDSIIDELLNFEKLYNSTDIVDNN